MHSTCSQCGGPQCQAINGGGQSKSNNSGAIAGGVVAAIVVILLAVGYLWYRRRRNLAAAAAQRMATTVDVKPDVVASADTVLNRPDPLEKPPSLSGNSNNHTIPGSGYAVEDYASSHGLQPPENPFEDHASIATASDRGTNAIPIGLITPSSASVALSNNSQNSGALTPASISTTFSVPPIPDNGARASAHQYGPVRPQRAGPELDMRLDWRPASEAPSSILLPPNAPYAHSSRSGVSKVSSRASTISTSSSFLNEAPQIVTPKQANFRQVLGVQRAEVVKLGSTPPSPSASVRSNLSASTVGKGRSPLAQVVYDADDANGAVASHNPFADQDAVSPRSAMSPSPVEWNSNSRPTSSMSAAESIVNISSAQRVQLVKPATPRVAEARTLLAPPMSPLSSSPATTPRSADFRSAGQLSPPAQAIPRSFDDDHRISQSSLALTNRTSTTDSILEAFPFVPPSPISLHHNTNASGPDTPTQRTFQQQQAAAMAYSGQSDRPQSQQSQQMTPKPGRNTMGLSTISSASSGLGGFSFQFEDGSNAPPLPPGLGGDDRSRASLDTIQLSRDLAEFPLPGASPVTPKAN